MTSPERQEARAAASKLAIQFTAVILVAFAVLGLVVVLVVTAGQREAARQVLADASQVDSVHDAPRNLLVTVISEHGRESSPQLPKGLPDEAALARVAAGGEAERSTIQAGGQSYLTETDMRRGSVVQISYGLGEQAEEVGRLMLALVISGVAAVVAGALIAVFIARRAMRPLADALALQRRFVADASHELRTPLTLLSTRAQLLRRRVQDAQPSIDPEVATGIDEIVDDSKALSEIVEDLLIAADPRQAATPERVDLALLAGEVARSGEAPAAERGIRIETHLSAPAVVSGTPVSLRRMVVALVDNAVDYASSRVIVAVQRDKGGVVLSVSDDGPGFDIGQDQRVFARFASARGTDEQAGRARGARHYGLGLALVAEVVARHHGTVEAVNEGIDGGARVTVRLPHPTAG